MKTVYLDNQPMMFASDFYPTNGAINANKRLKINRLFCLKSGWGDSNARPLRPERSALPTALHPDCQRRRTISSSLASAKVMLFFNIRAKKRGKICRIKKINVPLHSLFGTGASPQDRKARQGTLAQVVEQWTENPCVLGSTPRGTTKKLLQQARCRSFFFYA